MANLEDMEEFIRDKIVNHRWTHPQLSEFLRSSNPGVRGYSVRSIERFCSDKGIHKTSRPCSEDLDRAVTDAVAQVYMYILQVCVLWGYDYTGGSVMLLIPVW